MLAQLQVASMMPPADSWCAGGWWAFCWRLVGSVLAQLQMTGMFVAAAGSSSSSSSSSSGSADRQLSQAAVTGSADSCHAGYMWPQQLQVFGIMYRQWQQQQHLAASMSQQHLQHLQQHRPQLLRCMLRQPQQQHAPVSCSRLCSSCSRM
uniref:Uncharacterized protein n=1 Tax=Tetradesmus obliquus TaxID=3088 RepID=A0A383W251_TETOB